MEAYYEGLRGIKKKTNDPLEAPVKTLKPSSGTGVLPPLIITKKKHTDAIYMYMCVCVYN